MKFSCFLYNYRDTKPLDVADVKAPMQCLDVKDANIHIGTVRPDEDFISILKNGVALNKGKFPSISLFPIACKHCLKSHLSLEVEFCSN